MRIVTQYKIVLNLVLYKTNIKIPLKIREMYCF